jgi:hypothetical protein
MPRLSRPAAARTTPARRRSAALVAAAVAAALLGCCVSAPEPEDWLAAGAAPFRTPEATFRTFRTALAGDAGDLEYRCWSVGFKRAHSVTQLVYLEFRKRLLEENPWARHLARAKVVETRTIAPDRVLLVAEVDAFFKTVRVHVGCVREEFFDVIGPEFSSGDALELESVVRASDGAWGEPGLAVELWVPLPEPRTLGDVSEIRVGREWKIDSLETIAEPTEEP